MSTRVLIAALVLWVAAGSVDAIGALGRGDRFRALVDLLIVVMFVAPTLAARVHRRGAPRTRG